MPKLYEVPTLASSSPYWNLPLFPTIPSFLATQQSLEIHYIGSVQQPYKVSSGVWAKRQPNEPILLLMHLKLLAIRDYKIEITNPKTQNRIIYFCCGLREGPTDYSYYHNFVHV